MIGLKYWCRKNKEESFKQYLCDLGWEIRYAWLRAWQGYDDRFVFAMDNTFVALYKEILKDYRDTSWGRPGFMTDEEWNNIINEMIIYLERIHGDKSYGQESITYKDKFFKLFSEHFNSLWD